MATLLEMTADIVASHARTAPMTTDEIIQEIKKVHGALQSIEAGGVIESQTSEEGATPSLTIKQAFKTNEVVCMLCGKGGMKTLTRHLNQAHQVTPSQYRKQFNIPQSQPLMSKNYTLKRKEIAAGMDLGANLVKAREARQVNIQKAKGKKK